MRLRSATVLATAVGLLGAAPGAALAQGSPQRFFRKALLADARTTPTVRAALRSGAVFVDPAPLLTVDLTGDGRADAVVPVLTGGAAGTIAVTSSKR